MRKWFTQIEANLVWRLLIWAAHRWTSRHMDQFETVKFETTYGTVYFSLSRRSDYPDGFDPVTKNGTPLPRQ